MKCMTTAALILGVISLALASVAYWRSGGQQDVKKWSAELEALRVKQKELAESVAQSLAAAYEQSRQRLAAARETLRREKEETVEGLEKQLKLAQEQLEALARRLEEAAKAAKDATVSAAQTAEEAIAERARRIEARATLLKAKSKAKRAVTAAEKKEFDRADQLLDEATELLRSARQMLGDDRAYDHLLDNMKLALRNATTAVRVRAEDVRKKIDQALADSDRLVGQLESDETTSAKH